MKQAYLILAHSQYELLSYLVESLDQAYNHIFIHIDSKVAELPVIRTKNAKLTLLEQRIDVRWGDISVIEAEYALFEAARQSGSYDYFHLISGVDLPIKSSTAIQRFLQQHQGKEFIGFYQDNVGAALDRKIQRYHIFPKDFRKDGSVLNTFKSLLRALFLRIQILLGIRRHRDIDFKKGTQWVSVTADFVDYLLSCKASVLKTYQYTYCPDEVYKQTLCWNSPFRKRIYDDTNEGRGSLRVIGWRDRHLYDWTNTDFEEIMGSEGLFARKFNTNNMEVVQRILQTTKTKD